MHIITRRKFILAGAGSMLIPAVARAQGESAVLGVIADLHHGLAPDALERLEEFMTAVGQRKPDAIIQLGDFNYATPESEPCMELWNSFSGPRFHVLGNHDMDFETKEAVVENWGMPHRYYDFEIGGFHVVVLDRNNLKTDEGFVPYSKANFYVGARQRAYADPEQLEWLKGVLKASSKPVVVFAHQGLGHPRSTALSNRPIEQVFEAHNEQAGWTQVVACLCGHHHIDRHIKKQGIDYLWINSASYYWVGSEYGSMAFYQGPLFTFMTLDGGRSMTIESSATEWAAPSPQERGFPGAGELTTFIEERQFTFGSR